MLPVVILAGGLATRLGDLARDTPKSLIPVAGRPFIHHQLDLLRGSGVERVVICAGHLGLKISKALGDGSGLGIAIDYSFDGTSPLGTGGAVRNALPKLPGLFLILYGDSYLEIDYRDVAKAFLYSGKLALMTVFRNTGRWDRSNAVYENGLVRLYDKKADGVGMQYIDYGLTAMTREVLEGWPGGGRFDLADVLADLSVRKELAGYEARDRFYEIGSPAGIADLEKYLASRGREGP
ncbi:MAG: NTP transferase domain-containing protein [Deltaproteobacteria bacterium]|jgi:NDP-sugar pyrophosphorylase family protein|nr:NTP transferase domain-containing protein [Deltaproteobacteria bacterium]